MWDIIGLFVAVIIFDVVKQKAAPLKFLDMNYSLKSTVFFSSEVNIFKCAVHYVVYLISFEGYLLQVPSGKADIHYTHIS
jgi:hypothetical protein